VLLGSSTALGASDLDGTARWLELTVEGEILEPRIRLTNAPYAIRAEEAKNADTLAGEEATAFAGATHDQDADYVNEGQADSVTSRMIITDSVTAVEMADGSALTDILDDDGHGSGLDADTVDGLGASQIRDYDNVVVVAKSGGDSAYGASETSCHGPPPTRVQRRLASLIASASPIPMG
jgi:hypothetical protein